ncbi:MAG: CbbX protein, partial [Prochlorococcus sp.]
DDAVNVFEDYIERRRQLPFFANARSIRNALDRTRLRQANRLFARMGEPLSRDELMTIEPADILASRVFQGEVEGRDPSQPLTNSLE